MAVTSFKEPLVIEAGTGVTVNLGGTELFGKQARSVDISIGQAVAKTSDVVFNQLTVSPVIIDAGTLQLNGNEITGSFTQTGAFTISSNLTNNGNLTVDGTLTAQQIETALTQSVTLFESGSTVFGIRQDDLRTIKIVVPNIEIQTRFDKIVLPQLRQIKKLEKQKSFFSFYFTIKGGINFRNNFLGIPYAQFFINYSVCNG